MILAFGGHWYDEVIRVIQNTDILELGSEHFTPHLDRPNDHLQLFRRLLSSSATSREPP